MNERRAPTFGDGAALHCPRCGSTNISHFAVDVFERAKEDGPVLLIGATEGTCYVQESATEHAAKNPSTRRHGLLVYFRCGACDAEPVLAIAQHKGETWIHWRDDDHPA